MRRSTIIGALLASVLALTACSPNEHPSPQPPEAGNPPAVEHAPQGPEEEHSGTDQEFAAHMLAHHEQALEMSELAAKNASSPQVQDLAGRIQQGQGPEVEQLRAFLGKAAQEHSGSSPEDEGSDMQGMGMQSEETMQALKQAQGSEFDQQWAKAMLDHHEGAVQMARTELEEGSAKQMRKLAEKIIATQQDEIDELKQIVG